MKAIEADFGGVQNECANPVNFFVTFNIYHMHIMKPLVTSFFLLIHT